MFTEKQEQLRARDNVKIVRTFVSSPFIYKGDSKHREENPNYHQPIGQREDGKFVDVEGRLLPLSRVPEHIREAGKPPKATAKRQIKMTLAEAMSDATAANAAADRPARRRATRKKSE